MPDATSTLHLVATYGYPALIALAFLAALGIGAPIPLRLLLLALGALSASPGGPNVLLLALCSILGAAAGHSGDYWAGRLGGAALGRRLARLIGRRGQTALERHAALVRGGSESAVLLSRILLTPIASPISLLAGAADMRFPTFLALELLGDAVYIPGNLALGRIFGAGLLEHGGEVPAFWIVVALATVLPFLLMRYLPGYARRRAASTPAESASATGAELPEPVPPR
jgi:membrane-associated protein